MTDHLPFSSRVGAFVALLLGWLFVAGGEALAGDERRALVIGNSAYTGAPPLKNPVNDAKLMAKTLEEVGFNVTLLTDADQKAMHKAMVQFGRSLRSTPGSVGLLYYAGHGVQANGANYMLPVSADIADESEIAVEGLDVASFLGTMESAGSKLNIVILDACRNNPFARSFRSAMSGLAQVQAASGMLIAYSTSPGKVAFDGEGLNSPYAMALDRFMREPGLPVEIVFKRVLADVEDVTERKQVPWMSSSFRGEFSFAAKGADVNPTDASAGSNAALERLFWESIAKSSNPAAFEAYLSAFPNGTFAQLAKVRVAELSSLQKVASAATDNSTLIRSTGDQATQLAPAPALKPAPPAGGATGQALPTPAEQPSMVAVSAPGPTATPAAAPAPAVPASGENALSYRYLFADSATRELADEDVKNLDCRKLWRARNEIYYRKGYCFKSEHGIRLFDNTNCTAAVVRTSGTEARNIRTIRTWEIRKACLVANLLD